jgi:dipeptidyl-peptidase-4
MITAGLVITQSYLVYTNSKKVWRQNTKGDYWVLNLSTGDLHQVGASLPSSSLMFAKFSPNGKEIAYVSNLNIFKEDLSTHKITQLTFDGGGNIINGTFDWVYEEELDDRDGFRWSDDGTEIAYWQSDSKGVGVFYLINNVDSNTLRPISFPILKWVRQIRQ